MMWRLSTRTASFHWVDRASALARGAALILLVGLLATPAAGATQVAENRVVVIIDASGSYRSRVEEAVERATFLLEGMAERKLKRWEAATDRITVISLDALPEVLWEGSLRELQATGAGSWASRFEARSDYTHCTDVAAAFRVAASRLGGDPRYVHKYLFAFSDLLHEPPTDSLRRCASPRPIPQEFPWEAFHDVSVAVFWVPPEQKLAWHRELENRGLRSAFALYSSSEAGEVTIAPPPRAQAEVSDGEREAERARVIGLASRGLRLLLWVALTLVGLFLGFAALAWLYVRLRGARRRAGAAPGAAARTVRLHPSLTERIPRPGRPESGNYPN